MIKKLIYMLNKKKRKAFLDECLRNNDNETLLQYAKLYLHECENLFDYSHKNTLYYISLLIETYAKIKDFKNVWLFLEEYKMRLTNTHDEKYELDYKLKLQNYYFETDDFDNYYLIRSELASYYRNIYEANKYNIYVPSFFEADSFYAEGKDADALSYIYFTINEYEYMSYEYLYLSSLAATIYEGHNNYKEAKFYLDECYCLSLINNGEFVDLNKERIYADIGLRLVNCGDYEKALYVLEKTYERVCVVDESEPIVYEIIQSLFECYFIIGQYDKAEHILDMGYKRSCEIYGECSKTSLDLLLYKLRIPRLDTEETLRLADQLYYTSIDLYGENHEITLYNYYIWIFFQSGLNSSFDKINALENLIDKSEDFDNLHMKYTFLIALSRSYYYEKNYDKAIDVIEEIEISILPSLNELLKNVETMHLKADCYKAKGDLIKAKDISKEAYYIVESITDKDDVRRFENLNIMICNGNHDKIYLKEYLRLFDKWIWIAYSNSNQKNRHLILKEHYYVYSLLNRVSTVEDYNDLLKYKYISYDIDYAFTKAMHNEEIQEYMTMVNDSHLFDSTRIQFQYDNNTYSYTSKFHHDIYTYSLRLQSLLQETDLRLVFEDNLLHRLQEYLNEDECIVDIYQREKESLFLITKDSINLYDDLHKLVLHLAMFNHLYKHIYISPDKYYYIANYESVFDCYMIGGSTISYVSSPKFLIYDNGKTKKTDIEIIGDIDYSALKEEVYRDVASKLAFSHYEVNIIKNLYNDRNVILHTNKVSKEEFLAITSPKILHVSAHGNFFENDEIDVMERGVIVLGDDEYVSAKDIANMDLRGTELVSLATCYSGYGEFRDFEGLYGLCRAFELAGAKTLLLVKESINDMFAAAFMIYFYKYLKTYSVTDAFMKARDKMMNITLEETDQLFGLNEHIIRDNKLGFHRREFYNIISDEYKKEKEINKFIIQGKIR